MTAARIGARVARGAAVLAAALACHAFDASAEVAGTGRVLVVPFQADASSGRTFWLGEGAALLVGDELRVLGVATVSRRHRVRALEELKLPEAAPLSRATAVRVGQTLGVDALVLGGVELDDRVVTLRARVLAIDAGRLMAELTESGEVAELDDLCRRLARRLGDMAGDLLARGAASAASPAVPLEALEAYVKALLTPTPAPRRQLLEAALSRYPAYGRARLALWETLRELGEHDAALAAVRAVPVEAPLARRARFAQALSQLDLQRHDEAFETLRGLLDEEPSGPVLNNLGVVQLRRGSTAHTGTPAYYFTRATEIDPHDPAYYFNLGYAYWLANDPPASVYWLREAVRRQPSDADAHFVLGQALTALGASAEATREFDLARRLSARYERVTAPDVPRGLERPSDDLDAWQPLRFEASVTRSLQQDRRELSAFHLERGRRLFDGQKDSEALGELRRALYLSPYLAEAHLLLGRIFLRTGRTDDAIDALRISLWSTESAAAHLALAEAWLDAGDLAAARAAVERALVLEPDLAGAKALLERLGSVPVR
jgi:tetratricopeptide (TPR) repeat protein